MTSSPTLAASSMELQKTTSWISTLLATAATVSPAVALPGQGQGVALAAVVI